MQYIGEAWKFWKRIIFFFLFFLAIGDIIHYDKLLCLWPDELNS